ncbi:MAG: OmpA family protein [Bacteroidota bacterium]
MNGRVLFLLLLTAGWFGLGGYWYTCKIRGHCPGGNVDQAANSLPTSPLPEPAAETTTKTRGPLTFNWSDNSPLTTDAFADYRDSILGQLTEGKLLNITGHYSAKETNNTSFDNLGLARASAIKDILANKIDPALIRIFSHKDDDMDEQPADPFAAAGFSVSEKESAVIQLDDAVVIEFPYASTNMNDQPGVSEYLDKLSQKMKSEGTRITITGHTDNKGSAETNYKFGMERAIAIQNLLLAREVHKGQILTASKGQVDPIASNETDAGRQRNRRVEITIDK